MCSKYTALWKTQNMKAVKHHILGYLLNTTTSLEKNMLTQLRDSGKKEPKQKQRIWKKFQKCLPTTVQSTLTKKKQ
jgi:hypothetical protein